MPGVPQFGGEWTDDKLLRLRKYLQAYVNIFHGNERARFYQISYVDAFAGAGHRIQPGAHSPEPAFPEFGEPDVVAFRSGSARVALQVRPSFHRYVFIERDRASSARLTELRHEFPGMADRMEVHHAEANAFVQTWCQHMDAGRERAVMFLDPYGMQVDWATVGAIASTKAIDLWVLFPLGAAVNRLLTRAGPPPSSWASALDRLFGTDSWRQAFYTPDLQIPMFDATPAQRKTADFYAIGRYFVERLQTVFAGVAQSPLPLYNTRGVPIYLLCFAAGNPRGAQTAVKIAGDILRR